MESIVEASERYRALGMAQVAALPAWRRLAADVRERRWCGPPSGVTLADVQQARALLRL